MPCPITSHAGNSMCAFRYRSEKLLEFLFENCACTVEQRHGREVIIAYEIGRGIYVNAGIHGVCLFDVHELCKECVVVHEVTSFHDCTFAMLRNVDDDDDLHHWRVEIPHYEFVAVDGELAAERVGRVFYLFGF